MAEILRADHVSKAFGDNRILGDIDIHLQDGELVCVLGVSGVGKTTLFNVLSGLIRPDSGRVELRDDSGAFEDVTGQAGRISYMLQKDMLLPHKTIIDNVSLPLLLKGTPKKAARAAADRAGAIQP